MHDSTPLDLQTTECISSSTFSNACSPNKLGGGREGASIRGVTRSRKHRTDRQGTSSRLGTIRDGSSNPTLLAPRRTLMTYLNLHPAHGVVQKIRIHHRRPRHQTILQLHVARVYVSAKRSGVDVRIIPLKSKMAHASVLQD